MARQPVVYILASPNHRALYVGITTTLIKCANPEWLDLSNEIL